MAPITIDSLGSIFNSWRTEQTTPTRLVIPVNIENRHWTVVLIEWNNVTNDDATVTFVDPLGNCIPLELVNTIRLLIGGKLTFHLTQRIFQLDGRR